MARKTPPGFMVYEESANLFSSIPDVQAGRIIKAVCHFYLSGEIPKLSKPIEQATAQAMIDKIIKDAAAYVTKCETNTRNINKRWHNDGKTSP